MGRRPVVGMVAWLVVGCGCLSVLGAGSLGVRVEVDVGGDISGQEGRGERSLHRAASEAEVDRQTAVDGSST